MSRGLGDVYKRQAEDWEVAGWVTSYQAIAAGELETVSDAVPTLTGRPATGLSAYLRDHPDSYRHLLPEA